MGLAVHSKNNLDGVIRSVFGDDVIRVLDRDNKLDLKGITIQLLTEKIQIRRLERPVLAAIVDPKCRRRLKFDPPCRLNFDPGMGAGVVAAGCG